MRPMRTGKVNTGSKRELRAHLDSWLLSSQQNVSATHLVIVNRLTVLERLERLEEDLESNLVGVAGLRVQHDDVDDVD